MSALDEVKAAIEAMNDGGVGFDAWWLEEEVLPKAGFEVMESRQAIDTGRWSILYRSVFGKGGEFVGVTWSAPATEMQETEPYPQAFAVEAVPSVKYRRVTK